MLLYLNTAQEIASKLKSMTKAMLKERMKETSLKPVRLLANVRSRLLLADGVADGKKRIPVEDTSVNAKLASMLLRQRKERNSDKYGCHPRKSYFEAIDICRNKGLRLCTLEEAKQCRTCGTKCGFNRKRIWTSSGEVKVQEKDPVDDDTPMVPHNKTKVYPGGWEQLSKFTVAEDGDRLSRICRSKGLVRL